MRSKLVRIGNSRGVRIPREMLGLYAIEEGDPLELQQVRDGILIRPVADPERKIGWAQAYQQMAAEAAEQSEWSAWDVTGRDGLVD